jgi:hypothetical protein
MFNCTLFTSDAPCLVVHVRDPRRPARCIVSRVCGRPGGLSTPSSPRRVYWPGGFPTCPGLAPHWPSTPVTWWLTGPCCVMATVTLRRPAELRSCPLSCAVSYPISKLQAGGRLLWDYDGGASGPRGNAAYSMDLACSLQLREEGVASVPYACRGAQLCPLRRWVWVW